MKKISVLGLASLFLATSLFTSCDVIKNANDAQLLGAAGAVVGAGAGAIIGNNVGNGQNAALGAAAGAIIGGAAGALIGHKMDKQAREIQQALPAANVERTGEGIHLVLGENAIRFETGKATLTPAAMANLEKLVSVFKDYKDTNITIYGYTDNSGSDNLNQTLSNNRANTVKNTLAAKGLSVSRFNIQGMGAQQPIADNSTPAGKSQNRRVEFIILANDKMVQDAKAQAGN